MRIIKQLLHSIVTFIAFLTLPAASQAQSQNTEVVFNRLVEYYNKGNYDSIFNSFSVEMKKFLPLAESITFFTDLKKDAGKILEKKFIEKKATGMSAFKTIFENDIFEFELAVNQKKEIESFSVQPFVEKLDAFNAIADIPSNLSKVIFEKVKLFPNGTQLSIGIIQNGVVKHYGVKKLADTIRFINNQESIFEIGSITKVFTSTLLANAVMEKKIDLDDNINSLFDFPFHNSVKLNFQNLANHTAGLDALPTNLDLSKVDPANPYKEYNIEKLNQFLKSNVNLNNATDKKYKYSNLGAGLLGSTLAKLYKSNYETLLLTKIFSKYGMKNSTTTISKVKNTFVTGQDQNGKEIPHWEFDALAGAGAIFSSTQDLAKFVQAQLNPMNKELALMRIPTFTVTEKMKIGLGWHILQSKSGKELYWHNGGTAGFTSSLSIDEKKNNAVIILSNVSAFNTEMGKIDALGFELIEIL